MATKVGTLVLIKVADGLLVGQNSLSFNTVASMIEISNKTTGNYAAFESGRITGTLAVGGIASTAKEATAKGYWELYAAQAAGTAVEVTFTEYTTAAGTVAADSAEEITVQCLISNLSLEAPDNESNTFSCDFQVTGAPVQATNPVIP